ncbi:MAG: helix-turn-helix domain-containing protein [Bacteroidia bacterium]
MKKKKTVTLDEFVTRNYGKRGTAKRDAFEVGYEQFKIGALLQEARLKRGLTQEELALKCGTTKSYISKIENDIKEVRISTLQKIVELGLGGTLKLSIKL